MNNYRKFVPKYDFETLTKKYSITDQSTSIFLKIFKISLKKKQMIRMKTKFNRNNKLAIHYKNNNNNNCNKKIFN